MNVARISGANAFYQRAAAQKPQRTSQQDLMIDSAASRRRDRIDLRYDDIVMAEQEGYVEVDGKRYAVSEEMLSGMKQAYEQLNVRNEGIKTRLDAAQKARLEKQQTEMAKQDGKSMQRAMQIARRISEGGRVPAEDEHFLMAFSEEMYQAAKMMSSMAEEQKDCDSVFEDGELAIMDAQQLLEKLEADAAESVSVGEAPVEVCVG